MWPYRSCHQLIIASVVSVITAVQALFLSDSSVSSF